MKIQTFLNRVKCVKTKNLPSVSPAPLTHAHTHTHMCAGHVDARAGSDHEAETFFLLLFLFFEVGAISFLSKF